MLKVMLNLYLFVLGNILQILIVENVNFEAKNIIFVHLQAFALFQLFGLARTHTHTHTHTHTYMYIYMYIYMCVCVCVCVCVCARALVCVCVCVCVCESPPTF